MSDDILDVMEEANKHRSPSVAKFSGYRITDKGIIAVISTDFGECEMLIKRDALKAMLDDFPAD